MKLFIAITFLLVYCISSSAFAVCINTVTREAPDSRYQVEGALVTDAYTGLMWSRCPLGTLWSADSGSCMPDSEQPLTYTWGQALQAASDAAVAGHNDWRLPNKNELSSLIDRACSAPAMNDNIFAIGATTYWTSTPGRREDGFAWHVNFLTGTLIVIEMSDKYAVRLVRSP